MPIAPKDDFDSIASTTTTLSGSRKRVYDKEKSLPPFPASGLKKMSANSSRTEGIGCSSAAAAATRKYAFPRTGMFSSTSSASASIFLSPSAVLSSLPSPSVHQAARAGGDRPPVPVPKSFSSSTVAAPFAWCRDRAAETENRDWNGLLHKFVLIGLEDMSSDGTLVDVGALR
ncbi:hypothetical protein BDZ97DRAFT_1914279 [Flammula alnicola]|nr:hypothetical protein BDZ97DRAFT_1929651 [Flammula alnicola]KAF8970787.1 hypothetical protein BDZ97DRAFT_1914279 [Flammula alnicola]